LVDIRPLQDLAEFGTHGAQPIELAQSVEAGGVEACYRQREIGTADVGLNLAERVRGSVLF